MIDRRNPYYKSIVRKHGQKSIRIEVIRAASERDAFDLERSLIAKFRTAGVRLANMTEGGEGTSGFVQPAHVGQAVAKAWRGRKHTAETKEKISRAGKGRHVTAETREKLRAQRVGKKRPPHVIAAMSRALKGRKQLPERKAATLKALVKAREAARAWHASIDGIAFHRRIARKQWENREWHEKSCEECGRRFRTPYPTRAKYCHPNCSQAALRRRRGRPVGVRPDRRKTPLLPGKRSPR